MFAGMLFGGWLVALTLFTIVFCRRWKDPASRFMAVVGIICWLAFPVTLFVLIHTNPSWAIIKQDLHDPAFRAVLEAPTSAPVLSPWLDSHRPRVWWATVFVMGLAAAVLLWLGLALIFLWMKTRREPPTTRRCRQQPPAPALPTVDMRFDSLTCIWESGSAAVAGLGQRSAA
jgi:hypothetical protein